MFFSCNVRQVPGFSMTTGSHGQIELGTSWDSLAKHRRFGALVSGFLRHGRLGQEDVRRRAPAGTRPGRDADGGEGRNKWKKFLKKMNYQYNFNTTLPTSSETTE